MKQATVIALAFSFFTLVVIFTLAHSNQSVYVEATPKEQERYRIEDSIRAAYYTDTFKLKVKR